MPPPLRLVDGNCRADNEGPQPQEKSVVIISSGEGRVVSTETYRANSTTLLGLLTAAPARVQGQQKSGQKTLNRNGALEKSYRSDRSSDSHLCKHQSRLAASDECGTVTLPMMFRRR